MRGAYLYSREKESEATEDSLKVQSKKWFSSEPVKAYVELNGFKAKVLKDSSEKEVSEADAIFDRVADLLDGFTLNADPRIAIQAADKLANLYQLKTKPAEEQEKRKHYYLPLRCEDCAIYKYVRDNGIKLKPNN